MATQSPVSTLRQPFAELSGQRLQQLTSIKNRQNAISSGPATNIKSPLSKVTTPSTLSSGSKKRSLDSPAIFNDSDGENVDPAVFLSPSKKTKSNEGLFKPIAHSPSFKLISKLATSPATPRPANISSPRAPSTAPAGRSPPRNTRPADPKRRISAPYTRIDPPTSARKSTADALPFFSLEQALAGTRSRASLPASRTMPKAWFFAIHEDTADQEAQNLMEHSASILDISTDEESARAKAADRGKENVAPADFVASAQQPQRGRKGKAVQQRRRKVVSADGMDDGERSPLSEVEREDFFPEGVTADQVVVVDGDEEAAKAEVAKTDEIVIFEDSD